MKYLIPALLLASLAFTSRTVLAQADTINGVEVSGRLSRPSPTPATEKAATKKEMTVRLTNDEKGKGSSTVFAKTDAKIYLFCRDGGGVKGDKIRVVWTAEDTNKVFPKNKKLTEFTQTMTGPSQDSSFYIPAPAGGFPVGKYRADVFNDDKMAGSVKFTVK